VQVEALEDEIAIEKNRQGFLVGKLLATSRASLTGKMEEKNIFRELGVTLD
jgi:hypothetical protein